MTRVNFDPTPPVHSTPTIHFISTENSSKLPEEPSHDFSALFPTPISDASPTTSLNEKRVVVQQADRKGTLKVALALLSTVVGITTSPVLLLLAGWFFSDACGKGIVDIQEKIEAESNPQSEIPN